MVCCSAKPTNNTWYSYNSHEEPQELLCFRNSAAGLNYRGDNICVNFTGKDGEVEYNN